MYLNDVCSLKEEIHCGIQASLAARRAACPSEQRVCVNCTDGHFRIYVAQKFYMFSKKSHEYHLTLLIKVIDIELVILQVHTLIMFYKEHFIRNAFED